MFHVQPLTPLFQALTIDISAYPTHHFLTIWRLIKARIAIRLHLYYIQYENQTNLVI